LLANSQPHLELDQIKARKGAGYDVVALPTLLGGSGFGLLKLQEINKAENEKNESSIYFDLVG
jgi:hypothetical protein